MGHKYNDDLSGLSIWRKHAYRNEPVHEILGLIVYV